MDKEASKDAVNRKEIRQRLPLRKLDAVGDVLVRLGVTGLMLTPVRGTGKQKGRLAPENEGPGRLGPLHQKKQRRK